MVTFVGNARKVDTLKTLAVRSSLKTSKKLRVIYYKWQNESALDVYDDDVVLVCSLMVLKKHSLLTSVVLPCF